MAVFLGMGWSHVDSRRLWQAGSSGQETRHCFQSGRASVSSRETVEKCTVGAGPVWPENDVGEGGNQDAQEDVVARPRRAAGPSPAVRYPDLGRRGHLGHLDPHARLAYLA